MYLTGKDGIRSREKNGEEMMEGRRRAQGLILIKHRDDGENNWNFLLPFYCPAFQKVDQG